MQQDGGIGHCKHGLSQLDHRKRDLTETNVPWTMQSLALGWFYSPRAIKPSLGSQLHVRPTGRLFQIDPSSGDLTITLPVVTSVLCGQFHRVLTLVKILAPMRIYTLALLPRACIYTCTG